MSDVLPGQPDIRINKLAEFAQLIAHYLGMLTRSKQDGLLPDIVCGLDAMVGEAREAHGVLLQQWVDPTPPEWATNALGAVPAVIRLAQQVVSAAAAAALALPEHKGFKTALRRRLADCSAGVALVLVGYDEERVRADVVRSAMRMNGGAAPRVLGWSDGGQLLDLISAFQSLPKGYATAPPGTLAAGPGDRDEPAHRNRDRSLRTGSEPGRERRIGGDNRGRNSRQKVLPAEVDQLVRQYLQRHGKSDPFGVTIRAVAAATGFSIGRVHKTAAWQAFEGRRKILRPSGQSRTVPLSGGMLATVPDSGADDPAEIAAENEVADAKEKELADLIQEQERDMEAEKRPRKRHRS